MQISSTVALALLLGVTSTPIGAAPRLPALSKPVLKIYISVDMEGVAGVVSGDQLNPPGFEYERFRGFMTDEALAGVHAALDAGATAVVVSDSHGNGENLLIERFPKAVRLVRSFPRHGAMLAGLDASFAAVVFIGYHASTTNVAGVRAHTISSAHFTRVALNGVPVTEAEFNAAYAGDFGVPVVFVSGDDAAISEITARLGLWTPWSRKEAWAFMPLRPSLRTPRAMPSIWASAQRSGIVINEGRSRSRTPSQSNYRSKITDPPKC